MAMDGSENGGSPHGGGAVAYLADAYGDTPIEDESAAKSETAANEDGAQQALDASAVGTPTTATAAPASTDSAVEHAVVESETEGVPEPFRVFADEAEYQRVLNEATGRATAGQAAADRRLAESVSELEKLRQEHTTLVNWRNEVYLRSQSEDVTPQMLVEAYTRREGESAVEFATRKFAATELAATEARQAEADVMRTAASSNATQKVFGDRAYDLVTEIGVIPGFDVRAALDRAIRSDPAAQRLVARSYNAVIAGPDGRAIPDIAERTAATAEAYRIGFAKVRATAEALKTSVAKTAKSGIVPATSLTAPSTTGIEVPRYASPMDALSAAYR